MYGAEPRILQQAPGGRLNAKMVGKQIFRNFSLPHSDGNYFLRPDRILGAFLLDPANPIVGGDDTMGQEALAVEKARDATVKEVLGQLHEKMKQHRKNVEEMQKNQNEDHLGEEEQRRFSDRTSLLMNRLSSFKRPTAGQRQKMEVRVRKREGGRDELTHSPTSLIDSLFLCLLASQIR